MLEGGQSELLPRAAVLVLGYTPNLERTGVQRVSICPPCSKHSKPEWWIDLTAVPRMRISRTGSRPEITVQRYVQRTLGI
jgi:hypothetical protein